jgi:hypothetical protein
MDETDWWILRTLYGKAKAAIAHYEQRPNHVRKDRLLNAASLCLEAQDRIKAQLRLELGELLLSHMLNHVAQQQAKRDRIEAIQAERLRQRAAGWIERLQLVQQQRSKCQGTSQTSATVSHHQRITVPVQANSI